jgi:prepilin-type N-terminal cleavage/methylation domain-containing protein
MKILFVLHQKSFQKNGFSLIELLVVIALIAMLVTMLFPVFSIVRKKSYSTQCLSNLRQVGQAMAMYAQDYDGLYPYGADPIDKFTNAWGVDPKKDLILKDMPLLQVILQPYYTAPQIWHCPADTGIATMRDQSDPVTGEHIRLNAFPTMYSKFGSSYVWRTEFAFKHKLFSTEGRRGNEEVGPASLGILNEATGMWHGGYEFEEWRYNTLMGDGHIISQTLEQNRISWAIDLD